MEKLNSKKLPSFLYEIVVTIITIFLCSYIIPKLFKLIYLQNLLEFLKTDIGASLFALIIPAIGIGAYNLRKYKGHIFGLLEIVLGMVSGILLIKHLPKIELPIQIINYLGILVTGFSSIYLTVRGFDNYLKWRELRKFNSSNNNANKLIKIEEIVNKLSSMKITNSLIIQSELSDWNYNGTWGVINGNILSVENSDNGGVYKYGYSWSNYSFSFDFMLINSHAGWIVRSNEDGKQIMINISTNGLRCHCKESRSAKYKLINEYSISRNILNEWHHLETIVNGLNCQVLLDRAVIYSFAMPNDYAIGTVGFRCHSGESAQFRNIRVVADLI